MTRVSVGPRTKLKAFFKMFYQCLEVPRVSNRNSKVDPIGVTLKFTSLKFTFAKQYFIFLQKSPITSMCLRCIQEWIPITLIWCFANSVMKVPTNHLNQELLRAISNSPILQLICQLVSLSTKLLSENVSFNVIGFDFR